MHDDAKLGRFFEEDEKLVLRKQELIEKRDRLSKANAAMANIQVRLGLGCGCARLSPRQGLGSHPLTLRAWISTLPTR